MKPGVTGVILQKVGIGPVRIGVMCGSRWWRLRDWKAYPLLWNLKNARGFGIGPVLIWNGR
ncbi:hypothetical protein SEA_CRICKO_62 [Streptomyces phage CricKo]|nr:hypothetical protein SEA_RAINYDAI_60 [Streptomyces phage Rainydai]AWN06161.1 hypothetical protein SEA_SENDITCS_58 [Streptomyces phage SendItCS]QJD49945.1 hypothetical protein SEA_CRICKO_62 [Streptomyces phage CricKo]QNL30677.1 hypothetical protein SEA_THIQQUMS_62 [Streptomyces phage Thiqqums]WIC89396.1 hypothetical protein SEA_MIEK_59 [Streptomyces phage Miek]